MTRGVHRACMAERGVHGRGCEWQGACMVVDMCGRGVHGGGCAWQGGRAWQILRDTVDERAVRILLECILVRENVHMKFSDHVITIYFSPSSNTNRDENEPNCITETDSNLNIDICLSFEMVFFCCNVWVHVSNYEKDNFVFCRLGISE